MAANTLFDLPPDVPLSIGFPPPCPDCSAELVRTSSRWFTCPRGHGGLIQAPNMRASTAEREERRAVATFGKAFLRFVEVERAVERGERAGKAPDCEDDDRCPHCKKTL